MAIKESIHAYRSTQENRANKLFCSKTHATRRWHMTLRIIITCTNKKYNWLILRKSCKLFRAMKEVRRGV